MHGRDFGKSLAKALHAAAFVIDGDENAGLDGVNGCAQLHQLLRIFVVAGKENHHPDQGVRNALSLVRRDLR